MFTTKCKKFKGEIENYLRNQQPNFDIKIDRAFSSLKFKTWLCRCGIVKKEGYPACHLMLVLFLLPMLRLSTVNGFCRKQWHQWSLAGKNTFYRFKHKRYRWRSFLQQVMLEIARQLGFDQQPRAERYFIIDDTVLAKRGQHIENVSYIYDHSQGRSVLGFCLVSLGLLTGSGYYPIDFSYRFGQKRHRRSPENIGSPRSVSGTMSHEAKSCSKLQLAVRMIQRATAKGIKAGYVLFDSWYGWPSFIGEIRKIDPELHVICRLKDSKTLYRYQGKGYQLSALYHKVKKGLNKSARTGLMLKRVPVQLPGSQQTAVIVFAKGYCEPEETERKGQNKAKKPKWVAFLSTDVRLQSASIIKKYTRRWSCEVACKQLLQLGKDASNSFQAQVFATTSSFLRYALLNYLNYKENNAGLGTLFEQIADDTATITYAGRIWDFFRGLFSVSLSKIFALFEIEEDFQSYLATFDQVLLASMPHLGWET